MMAGVYKTWSEIAADYGDGFEVIDELFCPQCGSANSCEVLAMPNPGGWMTRIGRARCGECGARFPIVAVEEEEEQKPQF